MKDLRIKMQQELRPGSFVLSNVFTIPGWRPVSSSSGTYLYRVPNDDKSVESLDLLPEKVRERRVP